MHVYNILVSNPYWKRTQTHVVVDEKTCNRSKNTDCEDMDSADHHEVDQWRDFVNGKTVRSKKYGKILD
jgi:hypothetical protein